MGIREWLKRLLGGAGDDLDRLEARFDVAELSRRLRVGMSELLNFQPTYHEYDVPKRSGGTRRIAAPDAATKTLQRRILRRLLGRLPVHPAAMGFRKGRSIATHAAVHAGRAVVVRMDVRDFFANTSARRVRTYFRTIGWDADAAGALVRLCAHQGALPQGAPTSPALSNLVNYPLDARLSALAARLSTADIRYSRYADDLTFSFAADDRDAIGTVIRTTKLIAADCGYRLHQDKKLSIRRRHQSQRVTGLVVNDRVALPRQTRRRLRAVEHHLAAGRAATLTPQQLAGWKALSRMIDLQGRADLAPPPSG